MYKYKFAFIGGILAPAILRLNIHGTALANDPKRFIMPILFGGIAGFLIGMMKDRWMGLNNNLEQLVEERTEELKKALEEVKTLREIIPICSFCKCVRNDEGFYEQIDAYFCTHSKVDFSHTVCPECMKKHYPEEYAECFENKKNE